MIPFTGGAPAKQFVKNEPNPVAIKNFVICGKFGKAHDFELYQGKGTGICEEHKSLGLGASVVLRLAENIPRFSNYKVCFDNYFTGFPLIQELMGGVDNHDFLIALYRIHAKTKKWPLRIIFHLVDLALANSWLEYREKQQQIGTSPRKIYDLLQFRSIVAETLMKAEVNRRPGRPRTSASPDLQEGAPPEKRSVPAIRPIPDVRYDGVHHWPQHLDGLGQHCKMEQCTGRSRIKCTKCDVFLWLMKERNCFKAFHIEKKL